MPISSSYQETKEKKKIPSFLFSPKEKMDSSATSVVISTSTTTTDTTTDVQHVTKKSSDELLRKFADDDDEDDDDADVARKLQLRILVPKRRRKSRSSSIRTKRFELGDQSCDQGSSPSTLMTERNSLLLSVPRNKSILLRQLGINRSQQLLKVRDFKNKSILATIGKTWLKTLEGATGVLLDRHYNRHRRLINDYMV